MSKLGIMIFIIIFVFYVIGGQVSPFNIEKSSSQKISSTVLARSGAAWPEVGRDPQHSGVARRIIDEGEPKLIWKWSMRGKRFLSPIVGYDGTIYITSKHTIYALSPYGKIRWSYHVSENITSPPAVDKEGNIYIGGMIYNSSFWGGHIYSIDKYGNLRWIYNGDGWVQSAPVVDSTGTIYFYSSSEYLYAFHSDGDLKWRAKIRGSFSIPDAKNTPAISLNGTIYFPAMNRVVILTPTGQIVRNITFHDSHLATYALNYVTTMGRDTIYIGIRAGSMGLYAIHTNGNVKWHYDKQRIKGTPAIAPDGTIYVVNSKNALLCLNSNGNVKWIFGGDKYLIFPKTPSISGNGIIYTTGMEIKYGVVRYYVYAITPDGKLKWEYEIDGEGNTPVPAGDGFLYVSTVNGTLYAIKIGKCVNKKPSPPGLRILRHNNTINFKIYPPFDDGGTPLKDYWLYRCINNGGFVKIAEINGTTYQDKIQGGKEYRYYITAVNSIGESERSNIVEVYIPEGESLRGNVAILYYSLAMVVVIVTITVIYYLRKRSRRK